MFFKYAWPYFEHRRVSFKKAVIYFVATLRWIHLAPSTRQMDHELGCSDTTFRKQCHPLLAHLVLVLDEVHWEDRLDLYNHTEDFPLYVTSIVDTCFVRVGEPVHLLFRHVLNQGKYRACGLKLELTCNFKGDIVDFCFPAGIGITNDNVIHDRRVRSGSKAFLPWEMCLGDGAYRGCLHCIAKFPLNFNQLWDPLRRRFVHFDLNEAQQEANRMISKPRQRIEHAVFLCSSKHRLFRVVYQGYYPELAGRCGPHLCALR